MVKNKLKQKRGLWITMVNYIDIPKGATILSEPEVNEKFSDIPPDAELVSIPETIPTQLEEKLAKEAPALLNIPIVPRYFGKMAETGKSLVNFPASLLGGIIDQQKERMLAPIQKQPEIIARQNIEGLKTLGGIVAQPFKDVARIVSNPKKEFINDPYNTINTVGTVASLLPSVASGLAGLTKSALKTGTSVAAGITSKPIESIEHLAKTPGAFTKANLADDALSAQKNIAIKALDDFMIKKNVSPKQVASEISKLGQKAREGIGVKLEEYGNKIQDKVASMPNISKKSINTDAVIKALDNYKNKLNKFSSTKLSPAEEAQIDLFRKDLVGGKGIFGKSMNLKAAHEMKQSYYNEFGKTYANPSYTQKVANAGKLIAKELNAQLRKVSPSYAKANDKYVYAINLKDELSNLLKLDSPEQTIEKSLMSLSKKDLGTQAKLSELDKILTKDKKFLSDLNKILDNKDYSTAIKMGELLNNDSSISNLESIIRQSLSNSPMRKYEQYKMLQDIENVSGKSFLPKLKDIVATSDIFKDKGLFINRLGASAALRSLLKSSPSVYKTIWPTLTNLQSLSKFKSNIGLATPSLPSYLKESKKEEAGLE